MGVPGEAGERQPGVGRDRRSRDRDGNGFRHAGSLAVKSVILLVAGLAMALVVAGPPRSAFAHAEYDRSDPAADALIHAAPARVDVWFTQPLFRRAGANTLVVTGGSGARVDTGEALLDDADRTHMSVVLPAELVDGEYTVAWTTLSATDGDAAEGSFRFTIDRSAPAHGDMTPTAPEQLRPGAGSGATAGGSGAAFPWWAAVAALGVLGAGGAGAWALLGREPR